MSTIGNQLTSDCFLRWWDNDEWEIALQNGKMWWYSALPYLFQNMAKYSTQEKYGKLGISEKYETNKFQSFLQTCFVLTYELISAQMERKLLWYDS